MKICIPCAEDRGLDSPVFAHFGSAPVFLIVDTESGECRTLMNSNAHQAHGMCQPLGALAGEAIDAIAVGGIGQRALARLQASGMTVYLADRPTVAATVEALGRGELRAVALDEACAGHGHQHGHDHDHGHGHDHDHGHGHGHGQRHLDVH
jgi:predicted Fe-Mo cluster-binding NifX family protein